MRTRSFRALLTITTLMAMTAACAQPTGYEPRQAMIGLYGYSDQQVGNDEYTVVVHGNELTTRERVARIALLRAAHLAIAQGRSHFVVVKRMNKLMPLRNTEIVLVFLAGAALPIPVGESRTREPDAVLLIRLLPEGATPGPEALVAAEVVKSLEAEFRRK